MKDQTNINFTASWARNRRLIVALLFAIIIAAVFWSQSRVPALNEKAQMGLRTSVSSIAFDVLLVVADDQPVIERVAKNTVNWLYTNWKGMTFGLLFAAAALTILGSIRQRSFRAPWLNTVSGMFLGAPLGVCVNCATPIAQGMIAAGSRLETALATLISSPMLNPIVLSMMFTLLPWELAAGNVLTVLILLSGIPFLVRRFGSPFIDAPPATRSLSSVSALKKPPLATYFDGDEDYVAAVLAVSKSYGRNMVYIVRLAVPLMLLAGALGSLAIELAPFARLSQLSPDLVVLLSTAVLATFLPVPMAFNVIVVMALQSNGMHPGIAAVLLFSLSVFSIYPATVIARFISLRLSMAIAVTVALLATALGLVTTNYFEYKQREDQQAIEQGLSEGYLSAYGNAMAVCNLLPAALQLRCFSDHIGEARALVDDGDLCHSRPKSVDLPACNRLVDLFVARELALETATQAPCLNLDSQSARAQCMLYLVLKTSVRNHDIGGCDELSDRSLIQNCRVQYLNASLLFNPDDSVCKGLPATEVSDCKVNARIYRAADTLNVAACNELPVAAQEHCRWVTATNLIGRSHDASACAYLQSAVLQARCNEHLRAWQATKTASFDLCRKISSEDLRDTCLLRVAGRKVSAILADFSLNRPLGPMPDIAPSDAKRNKDLQQQVIIPELHWQATFENADIRVSHLDHRSVEDIAALATLFSKVPGRELGISKSWEFRITDFFEPFIIGKGIASGDMNGDGWPDLVLASEQGALFYLNTGGRFQLFDVKQGELKDQNLFLVAFVDANNDGVQDLFASAYGGRNYLLINRGNGFAETELLRIVGDQRLTMSAGFGDVDVDGDMDIVLGNWSSGIEKLFSPQFSGNTILYREQDAYRAVPLDEIKGETNSVLLADINGDDIPDLLLGNDRTVPDVYYLGTAEHRFVPVTNNAGMVPLTSMFTMSLDAADFNNDLRADLFSTDMTFARSSTDKYCEAITEDDARARCDDILEAFELFSTGSAASCGELGSSRDVHDCYVAFSIKAAKTLNDEQYCENLPPNMEHLSSLCRYVAEPTPGDQRIDQENALPQTQRNVLLMSRGERFEDQGDSLGVASSFWSWNAKASDLDNDGWQDIYIGNGFHFGDSFYEVQANVLFHNLQGTRFEEVAAAWGLDDTINTPSYTYVDFDLDGDVDIVATGVLAPPRVYVNQQSGNNSVRFLLRQDHGNAFAIGAKISIRYAGQTDRQQRKEIKLSGGFMSFDNPVAHFGIGQSNSIDGFSITWPDGYITSYQGHLPANRSYRIRRK